MRLPLALAGLVLGVAAGCGTTRWTDTARTATEQLLISDSMDRSISRMDLRALAGRNIYLDPTPVSQATDSAYLVSTLRQHMLASGCILKEKREEADYVVEVRAGAIGTDKRELMFGVPAVTVPAAAVVATVPSSIPEIPFMKRTEQRAVTKLALFAYSTKTGRPVWQSGTVPVESTAKDIWVLGAGPFQRGSIYGGTKLAGDAFHMPLVDPDREIDDTSDEMTVADEAFFADSDKTLGHKEQPRTETKAAAIAESRAEAQCNSSSSLATPSPDEGVVPAGHASTSAETPSEPIAPKPPDSPSDRAPGSFVPPEVAAPMPTDLYPMLRNPDAGASDPPPTASPTIDPSSVFDR